LRAGGWQCGIELTSVDVPGKVLLFTFGNAIRSLTANRWEIDRVSQGSEKYCAYVAATSR
jgi:hypothetical protein